MWHLKSKEHHCQAGLGKKLRFPKCKWNLQVCLSTPGLGQRSMGCCSGYYSAPNPKGANVFPFLAPLSRYYPPQCESRPELGRLCVSPPLPQHCPGPSSSSLTLKKKSLLSLTYHKLHPSRIFETVCTNNYQV